MFSVTRRLSVFLLFVGLAAPLFSAPDDGPKKPRIFFNKNRKIVDYQLRRLSNDQLTLVDRRADDSKFVPLFESFLSRSGLESKYRYEAIKALTVINKTGPVQELLAAIRRADRVKSNGSVVHDLTHMLSMQSRALVAKRQQLFEQLVEGASTSVVRMAGYLTLARIAPAEALWTMAEGNGSLVDLLGALPAFSDSVKRDTLFPLVSAALSEDRTAAVRGAAIGSLPSFSGRETDTFAILVDLFIRDDQRPAVVGALKQLHKKHWSPAGAASLAEAIVRYAPSVLASERTESIFLGIIQLGNEAATLLPPERGALVRKTLGELGVKVVLIRAVPHRMIYDVRRVVVEAGKPVELIFENSDFMPHNLVVAAPGARQEIGIEADAMSATPDDLGRLYVPDSKKVLHATPLVDSGKRVKLSFVAPTKPGKYDYLCTFPGHWRLMYGALVVVTDIEEYFRNPPRDELAELTEWKLADFNARDFAAVAVERAVAGNTVFTSAGCAVCHSVGGSPAAFGPRLDDVFARWKNNRVDVLREILEPSRKIDEKYVNSLVVSTAGEVLTGLIVKETAEELTVQSGPKKDLAKTIKKSDVLEKKEQPISVMPQGALSPLSREQILDLLSFLEYGPHVPE